MAGAGLKAARQLGRRPALRHVIDKPDRTEPRGGRRDPAASHRHASGASGVDRIVGSMTATGLCDAGPSKYRRGATMGPPACSDQSSPVAFRRCRRRALQGLFASWGDWRGQKVFLIRKRSQVRVLDRPLSSLTVSLHLAIFFFSWRCRTGMLRAFCGATGGYCEAQKRSWVRAAIRSAPGLRERRPPRIEGPAGTFAAAVRPGAGDRPLP